MSGQIVVENHSVGRDIVSMSDDTPTDVPGSDDARHVIAVWGVVERRVLVRIVPSESPRWAPGPRSGVAEGRAARAGIVATAASAGDAGSRSSRFTTFGARSIPLLTRQEATSRRRGYRSP